MNTLTYAGLPLTVSLVTEVRALVESILYYARAIDATMLPTFTAIASEQAKLSSTIFPQVDRLLAYAAAYPSKELLCHASDMKLMAQFDASYLSLSRGRSLDGGIRYLGRENEPTAMHVFTSSVLIVVAASVAAAEYSCPPKGSSGYNLC